MLNATFNLRKYVRRKVAVKIGKVMLVFFSTDTLLIISTQNVDI